MKLTFDVKVIIVGIAGVFVALGLVAATMLGLGHVTTAVGQVAQSQPIVNAGASMSGLGIDLLVFLGILAITLVVGFLYFTRR